MSNTQVQRGEVIDFVTTGAVAVGAVIKASHTLGVALKSAAGSGETIPLAVEGVFTVPKVSGNAWVAGEKVIWDVSAGPAFSNSATVAATGDVLGGAVAVAAAASGDTTGVVKLTPGNTTLTP